MDWIKTGWGSTLQQTFSPTLPYVLDCTGLKITNKNFFDVSTSVIQRIANKYPGPYYIMASGGVDSQALIYCWMKSKVPFKILSYKYNDNYNEHDISNLTNFTNNFNLTVDYRNFDFLSFLDNELINYATAYQCISPQICGFMKICDQIDSGTIIFSGNFLKFSESGLDYTILGLQRYAKKRKNMIPFFFQHDPELAGYLLPFYKNIHIGDNKNIYFSKIQSYKFLNIPIIPQYNKLSGFEKIKDLFDHRHDLVSTRDKLEFSNKISKRYFDIHYRYKLSRSIKYIENVNYILPNLSF